MYARESWLDSSPFRSHAHANRFGETRVIKFVSFRPVLIGPDR